ncbi:S1 RNA-binding domain-containing protein [Sedimentibacter sp. zth1]|uniref:S1 RNA-binding domain-containing protein n=1 Tax=Sedimentibacter sp. zth1 TaxID=2816908 RepID=UPI001A90CC81|nr:S1 RNA-binding domain-containing protein [Sedimentibacter sp. zth1]QSX06784.1 S1 RNA-binding domain-containing protein [Sedimentibacter sp. zth1]
MSDNQNKTMSELFEDYGVSKIRTGDLIKGTVISVKPEAISINLNYKSDGVLTRDEYSYDFVEDLTNVVKEGDEVEALVVKLGDQDGNVVLTRKPIEEQKIWENFEKLKSEKAIIETKIIEACEFGIFGKVNGIKGFIPKNHISINRNVDPSDFVGKTLKVNILDTKNRKGRKQLVLTSKAIEKLEKEAKAKEVWNTLVEGEIYEGTVKNLQAYGAFVDINGVDGLLHINEISWNRIKHPSEVVNVGDKIKVKVKSIDIENKKLSLSYKATIKSPWAIFCDDNKVGQIVTGKVVRVVDFGAFVTVDDIDCLLHIKDISWLRIEKVTDVVNVGDEISVKIININKKERKVNLGMKQLVEHPFDKFAKDLTVGQIIPVKVTRILLEGVYVHASEDVECFVPIAKVSSERLRTPAKVVKIGEEKDAKITYIDRKGKKLDLTFVLEEKETDEFSSKKGPVSYSSNNNEEFTIGDKLKGLEDLFK